jgi:hypothetical protein
LTWDFILGDSQVALAWAAGCARARAGEAADQLDPRREDIRPHGAEWLVELRDTEHHPKMAETAGGKKI